ncbi:MAG: DUF5050 domain-containing protein [Defluviitaleaceae bacterium]|nr:DUF5050 domain-containing protein [Defluviitaleaceae bacterium]
MQTRTKVLIALASVVVASATVAVFISKPWENSLTGSGNTVGNIINRGMVAQSRGWIFYLTTSPPDGTNNTSIVRERLNGSRRQIVHSVDYGMILAFDVVGDWLFFSRHGNIYRIRADGIGLEHLNTNMRARSDRLSVVDGWIYAYGFGVAGEPNIFRMRTDGSNLESVLYEFETALDVNVVDGWIYFVHWDGQPEESFHIHKIRTDGTELTRLNYESSTYLNVVDGWIYYVNRSSYNAIYKMRIDGSENQRVTDDEASRLNVSDGWIYYSNRSNQGYLYRIRTDGTDREQIINRPAWSIHVIEDWIFFRPDVELGVEFSERAGENLSTPMYRIRKDGTGLEQFTALA